MGKLPKYDPTQHLVDMALPIIKYHPYRDNKERLADSLYSVFAEYWDKWSNGQVQQSYAPWGLDDIKNELIQSVNNYSVSIINMLKEVIVNNMQKFQQYDCVPVSIKLPNDLCLLLRHQELKTIFGLDVLSTTCHGFDVSMLISSPEFGRFMVIDELV
jgi:hypothetical protein